MDSLSKHSAYNEDAIRVYCDGCRYEKLCVYRREVQDAVRAVVTELRADDWSPGDDPVVTGLDIRTCSLYNPRS